MGSYPNWLISGGGQIPRKNQAEFVPHELDVSRADCWGGCSVVASVCWSKSVGGGADPTTVSGEDGGFAGGTGSVDGGSDPTLPSKPHWFLLSSLMRGKEMNWFWQVCQFTNI